MCLRLWREALPAPSMITGRAAASVVLPCLPEHHSPPCHPARCGNRHPLIYRPTAGVNPFEGCTPEVPEGEKLDFGSPHFRELEQAGIAAAGGCGGGGKPALMHQDKHTSQRFCCLQLPHTVVA